VARLDLAPLKRTSKVPQDAGPAPVARTTLGPTAGAIGVQGGRCASGHEEAIEVEAVIWIGIAAIIVIAAVIAAIGRPGDGPGRGGRSRNVGSSNARRRVGSYSGAGGYSGTYAAGAWSGDSGSGSCGDGSGGGGFSGGDCGGGGGSF
jgi:hypothetical protein